MSPIRWFAFMSFLILQGCGPITTIRPDGRVERQYIGYIKVAVSDSSSSSSGVSASDVTAIGLRIENGFGFGYFRDRKIVTPLDCRLVFLVQDQAQLEKTTQFFEKTMKGENICAAIY